MSGVATALGWLRGPGRRRHWRRQVLRRVLALACALGAAYGVVTAARSGTDEALVPVVVAARPLAVGQVATPASVREALWPAAIVPQGSAHRLDEVVGRTLTTPMGPGDPFTAARVNGNALLVGQPPDAVAVHVSLADPGAVSMVGAGDRVDLLGPDGVVAHAVVVLRVDRVFTTDFGAVLQGPGSSSGNAVDGPGIVVAAGQGTAEAIAAVPPDPLGRTALSLVLRSR